MSQIPREMKICWKKCIYCQSISQASGFGVKSAAQHSLSQSSPFAEIVECCSGMSQHTANGAERLPK